MSSDSEPKYLILVPDGMADWPVPELGGQTPLKAAKTPWMDKMASRRDSRPCPHGAGGDGTGQRRGKSCDHGILPVRSLYRQGPF